MKTDLLNYLKCPLTGEDLILDRIESQHDSEIINGTLISVKSKKEYKIENGIPNLIIDYSEKVELTANQFSFEHLEVGEHLQEARKIEEDILLFFLKTGIDSSVYELEGIDISGLQSYKEIGYEPNWSFLKDKVIVDAGAASGRFARLVAPHCKKLILLDIGNHLYKAQEELRKYDHVHFVKCNLVKPPLMESSIDFIYSIGVLHHTPDPKQSFLSLASSIKEDGSFSLWVYPPEYWSHPIKAFVSKLIRGILLQFPFTIQQKFIKNILLPIGRFQMKIAKSKALKLLFAPLFILNIPRHENKDEMLATIIDYYTPQFIFTYTNNDISNWFTEAGLKFSKLLFPTSAIGTKDRLND
ncbi:methyltransferase domain-containing protein [Salibacteraceae bacterium]|nr:methyltransferase domain-containing protein [Salibacteraceae bacterium]